MKINKKIFMIMMLFGFVTISLVGCGKKDKEQEIIDDGEIIDSSVDDVKDDGTLNGDFSNIDNAYDNIANYKYDDGAGNVTELNYDMTALNFANWGFSINIPKDISENYTKVSSLNEVSLASNEDMERTYVLSDDKTMFQILNCSRRYFAIFQDDIILTDEIKNAFLNGDANTISSIVKDNHIFKISDLYPSVIKSNGTPIGSYYVTSLNPLGSEDVPFNGFVAFIISNDKLYYVLYGESIFLQPESGISGCNIVMLDSIRVNGSSPVAMQQQTDDMIDNLIENNPEYEKEYEALREHMEQYDKDTNDDMTLITN